MTSIARATGLIVALVVAAGIRQASTARMTPTPSEGAVLRLAWTARPERIEDCRSQSEQELAKLPAHMRQAVICEGTTAEYRLRVERDGQTVVDRRVRGGGLRHDRPLYVFQDLDLATGNAAITVRFDRVGGSSSPIPDRTVVDFATPSSDDARGRSPQMDADRSRREAEDRTRRREEAVPPSLLLDRRVRFVARQVILVTYDSERRELVVVERPSAR